VNRRWVSLVQNAADTIRYGFFGFAVAFFVAVPIIHW